MRAADTRLPESPDITDFLRQWDDWHRGFRLIVNEDGTEQRQAMVGEPLSECAHGFLPRSVDELRNGLQPGDQERLERGDQPERPIAPVHRPDDDFVVPDDERLFDEEPDGPTPPPEPTMRQAAAAEHGHLAELAGDYSFSPPDSRAQIQTLSTEPSQPSDRTDDVDVNRPLRIARQHYQRVTNLRRDLQKMRISIDRVVSGLQASDIDVPDTEDALEQLNRLNERFARYQEAPLDMPEVNHADYVSPIGGMFERAWRWHHQVQTDRQHARSAQDTETLRDSQGRFVPLPQINHSEMSYEQMLALTMRQPDRDRPAEGQQEEATPFMGLDQPGRPPPIEDDEAFKVDTRCEVCLHQVANVATFPCGHMVMCSWCADEVIPRHVAARNVPRDLTAKCPQCRRKVKHVYKVHVRVSNEYKKEAVTQEQEAVEEQA